MGVRRERAATHAKMASLMRFPRPSGHQVVAPQYASPLTLGLGRAILVLGVADGSDRSLANDRYCRA
jgi:hypothetical protein